MLHSDDFEVEVKVESHPHSKALSISALLLISTWLRWSPSFLTPSGSSQGYRISREVSLVVLPVSVTDREGHFVSGLDASNFRIYDEGHPEQVTLFQRDDIPVIAGLVVDRSESMAAQSQEVLEGAMAFVQSGNPQDLEFVINFNDRVRLGLPSNILFTNNVDKLKAALTTPRASGETALYDAIVAGLDHLQEGQTDKKVLILISDGGDNASEHNFVQVVQMAQTLHVAIYSVGLLDRSDADQHPDILKALSRQTGGEAYFPSTPAGVVRVCQKIASDIRHHYTLGYTPAPDRKGGYRKIRVEVMASGGERLFLRTRTRYFLPRTPSFDFSAREGQHQ
jgi:Ca-activated chloride channel family protein